MSADLYEHVNLCALVGIEPGTARFLQNLTSILGICQEGRNSKHVVHIRKVLKCAVIMIPTLKRPNYAINTLRNNDYMIYEAVMLADNFFLHILLYEILIQLSVLTDRFQYLAIGWYHSGTDLVLKTT